MRDVQKVGIASVGSAFVTLAAAPTSTARPVTHLVVPPAQSAADEENDDASSGFSLFDEKPSPLAPVSSVPPSVPLAQHVAAPTVPENKPSGVTANVKPVIGKAARAPQQTVAQRVSKKPAAPLLENSDSDDFDLGSSGSEAPVSPRRSKQVPFAAFCFECLTQVTSVLNCILGAGACCGRSNKADSKASGQSEGGEAKENGIVSK